MPAIPSTGKTEFWDSYTAPILAALKKSQLTWAEIKVIVHGLGRKPYELYLQNALAYLNRKNLIVYNPETKLWKARGFTSGSRAKEQSVEKRQP